MIRPIAIYGSKVLEQESENVLTVDTYVINAMKDIKETLENTPGIGLAAPQINVPLRFFAIDYQDDRYDPQIRLFINPKIIEYSSKENSKEEGCLSIPSLSANVYRSEKIRVEYYDELRGFHDEEFSGTFARVFQHEYDHVNGILFHKRLSSTESMKVIPYLSNIKKGKYKVDYKTEIYE